MKKIILFTVGGLLCAVASFAQITLTGKVVDSSNSKPLPYATITVFKAADTSVITYRLTNADGNFKVSGIPQHLNCRVVVSYSGYAVYRKEFVSSASVDLGTIIMNARTMEEVVLLAERPPVVYRKDTIEFNANSFKTLPNALVEDLLKKLPGVTVDRDGIIMVQGKPVNRILVDGKTFFGDDPKMATKNLPADVIDKIQVTDDKEEMLRSGDDNPNNAGKIVNLTLKKSIKKGWFGRLFAGGGTDQLYDAGGIANIYRDTVQLSVLGYANNLNRVSFGFNELLSAGGFSRVQANAASTSSNVSSSSSGNSVSINGIDFGGAQNFGAVSASLGGGFNLNIAPNKNKSMYLQYFNGNVHSPRFTSTRTSQFIQDTVISTGTELTGAINTHSHTVGSGMRLRPDSLTNILINAAYTFSRQDDNRFNTITSDHNKFGKVSGGTLMQDNDSKYALLRQNFSILRLSKSKNGRRFNFFEGLDISNRDAGYASASLIHYFYPLTFDSAYEQLRSEKVPRTELYAAANYSEPLSKHLTLRIGGRYDYSKWSSDVSVFNGKIFNDPLSNDYTRTSNRITGNAALEYKFKTFTIAPGFRLLEQQVRNNIIPDQRQFNVLPSLTVVYRRFTLNYSKDVNLPSYTLLNPVTDLSNPYFITKGNPGLLSIRRNTFSFNYSFNNTKRLFSGSGNGDASVINNDIVQSITVDKSGVQTMVPVNVNGSKNYRVNLAVRKQYKFGTNSSVSWNSGLWTNMVRNTLFFNGTRSVQSTYVYNHWIGSGLNLNDKFEWNLYYSIGKNFTSYSTDQFKKLNLTSHYLENEFIVRVPKHFIWETQLIYSYNGSIPRGTPKDMLKWNAALNITMLKGEAGVLKFAVNDILKSVTNIQVRANSNSLTIMQGNILGRYFLASFTYNVRASGAKKKVGGKESLLLF